MLLTVDIGNTYVGTSVMDRRNAFRTFNFLTPEPDTMDPWDPLLSHWPQSQIRQIMVSSVVPRLNESFSRCMESTKGLIPRFVDHETPLEIELAVDNPREVGADRIADVVGALNFTSPPCLVIDSGTALTVDVLDGMHRYLGGVIVPGVDLSIRCLAANAARLERVEFRIPDSPLGRNTADCIRAGVFFSHLGGIEYLVREYRGIIGEAARVIATGGAMRVFQGRLPVVDHVVPDLIHHGLRRIYAGLKSRDEEGFS